MSDMQSESMAAMSGSDVPASITSNASSAVDLSNADVQAMSYQQIMPLLHGLEADRFAEAASAFKKLGDALDAIRSNLQHTGDSLASNQSWGGSAAQKAMDKFQHWHDQASVLSAQCYQAHASLDWFGREATPPYQRIRTPQVMSKTEADEALAAPFDVVTGGGSALAAWGASALGIGPDGQNKADKAARAYMTSYNQQLAKLNASLPNDPAKPVQGRQHFVQPGGRQPTAGGGAQIPGSTSAPVPGSSGPGTGANLPGYRSSSNPNPFTPSPTPRPSHVKAPGGTPANASLQGYTPPSAGTGSPFGGASSNLTGGGSANPFSRMPMMPGGAGAGAGEGAAGEGIPGGEAGGDAAGAGGAAGEGTAGAAAGTEAAGAGEGEGMGGMPMGGSGGGGQQGEERQRQAWMNQDDSIWGVPDDDVGPIIG